MSLWCSRFICFFFFSSRRRHTRCSRDWSSDVCSSDLTFATPFGFSWQRCKYSCLICGSQRTATCAASTSRSEEHTSELQSRLHLVCRLLLEKKKKKKNNIISR